MNFHVNFIHRKMSAKISGYYFHVKFDNHTYFTFQPYQQYAHISPQNVLREPKNEMFLLTSKCFSYEHK